MKARLIIDSTKRSADLYYLTGLKAPDPVIWLQLGRRRVLMLSELELDRARIEARADRFVALRPYLVRASKRFGAATAVHAAALFLEKNGVRRVEVPATFPSSMYLTLRGLGFDVAVQNGEFVPARRTKRAVEVREIERAIRYGAEGIAMAVDMVRRASVKRGILHLDGRPLTSERVRKEVTLFLTARGYSAAGLIVAGRKDQTSLPHHVGSGALRAGEPIILDFFPRSAASGFHGDITRTVLKGRALPAILAMARAVRSVERHVAARLRPGVRGVDLHARALKMFERAGFETGRASGKARGFFHGIGHGLGLEIHEKPSLSARSEELRKGDVVTVEPGLYYPERGGIRHENVYLVTDRGARCLTRCDVPFEII